MALAVTAGADDIGYADLVARVGAENVPTGAAVKLAQVEALSGTAYGPNQADPEFAGKTFTAMSSTPGNSGHATTVGKQFYGLPTSVAFGVLEIYLYEAGSFLQAGYLRVGSGTALPPLVAPAGVKVFNNSWIGSTGQTVYDNETLRRADFAMNRDGTLMTNGENNGAGSAVSPLMSVGYHGLAVGRMDGQHSAGQTTATLDGGGRMKPEIVAPGSATSFSTPVVGACAALLFDVAMTDAALAANLDARRPAVVKGCLLAGATHRAGWTNNPSTSGATRGRTATPLDPIYGVDLVNIDRAHQILTGGEVDGSLSIPSAPTTVGPAWSYPSGTTTTNAYYRFRIAEPADEVSIIATWHRNVPSSFGVPTVANFDVELFGVSGTTLVSLVGDGGASAFTSGNVVSESLVNNVEHLHVRGLAAGDYVIHLRRVGTVTAPALALAWLIPDAPPAVPGDVNGDGEVDGTDLALLLSAWGTNLPAGDFDGNGIIGGPDLAVMLGGWTL